jgi:hypothetical protein
MDLREIALIGMEKRRGTLIDYWWEIQRERDH